ncbi:hypothetical protein AB0K00_44995 [Dactylosporangium sp. NPDC049525]|uniref:hypothetical protein n=1 Tax=Dactylosporangium sp. NPDC049525 TaxID=3154730 RepID=UPI0034474332
MLELDLPDLAAVPLPLVDDDTVVRGPDDVPPEPPRRLFLGGPLAVPLTAATVGEDRDLRAFVEQDGEQHRYHLVHLAFTATAGPDEPPLQSAELHLRLSNDAGVAPAVAWSMAPERVVDPAQLTTKYALGPKLGLLGVDATLGSVERTTASPSSQVFLEALRLLRSDPAWRFQRTPGLAIDGSWRLVLVVRAPRGVTTHLSVTARATVRRGRLFGFRTPDLPEAGLAATSFE